jgi:hypothetical protein
MLSVTTRSAITASPGDRPRDGRQVPVLLAADGNRDCTGRPGPTSHHPITALDYHASLSAWRK